MERKPQILLVDDDPLALDLLSELLADEPYDVRKATSGSQALKMAEEDPPDLVLLDVVMPGTDGYEVCRRMRSHPVLAPVPVVMVTGQSVEESAVKGQKVGAEDVVAKPFRLAELKLRIKTIIQLNRYRVLQGERERFQWVVENSRSGYVMVNGEGRVTYVNPVASELIGVSPERLGEESPLLLPLLDKRFVRVTDEAWSSWPGIGDNAYLVQPQTEKRSARWIRVFPMRGRGGGDQGIFRLTDESERFRLENSAWSFETMVAHKLRTPLNGVLGAVQFLASDGRNLDPETVEEMARAALDSTQRLNRAIEAIISRVQGADREPASRHPVGELVKHCFAQATRACEIQPVEIACDSRCARARVTMSEDHLLMIAHEICENSRKFHPQSSPQLKATISPGVQGRVQVVVEDDGPGVDPRYLADLNAPYFQAERLFTGEVPGMGLGLTRMTQLVGTYGGKLSISNAGEGGGLRVWFELVRIDQARASAVPLS